MQILELQVENLSSPQGLDELRPAFSWQVQTSRRAWRQKRCRVLLAATSDALANESPLIWDSGFLVSDSPSLVPSEPLPLKSSTRYWWKVQVEDETGQLSPWSETESFGTGIVRPQDWQAKWIGAGPSHEVKHDLQRFAKEPEVMKTLIPDESIDLRSVLLRKSFNLSRRPISARVFVTGLGFYELALNGRKVGDQVLAPSRTEYQQSVLYDAFDITDLLRSGQNVLGIMLGNGWYNTPKEHWSWKMQWHGSPRAILQCHLEYADGSTEVIRSDDSWKTHSGPITFSCIYDGEDYDARLEQIGWNDTDFDASTWKTANIVEAPGGRLVYHHLPPIRVTEHIRPISMSQPRPGTVIFDLGQNFAGWVRLRVKGPKGTTVTLRFTENVKHDGTLNNRTSPDARQSDIYILRGDNREEIYGPRFTYHGFQYVEMTGFPGQPDLDTILGCVIRSDCRQIGSFNCWHQLIDHIHRCTVWAQKSNMPGLPTDDCQRAERMGWLADAQISFSHVVGNFEMAAFYRKYLRDLAQSQYANGEMPCVAPRPVRGNCTREARDDGDFFCWGAAYPLMTWEYYQQFGDKRILQEHLEGIKRFVDWMLSRSTNFILPVDHLADHNSAIPGRENGKPELASTWYFYFSCLIVARAAGVLGLEALNRQYTQLADQIREAFNRRFLNPASGQYGDGTQCEQLMPLYLDMVPSELVRKVQMKMLISIEFLWDGHLALGILGTRYILEYLDRIGRNDIAWRAVTKDSFPSWGRLCEGRTTLGECWNRWGTKNHPMFGVVDAWFHRALGGIRVDESANGADRLILEPYFALDLNRCRCVHPSTHGQVWSHWQRDRRGDPHFRVEEWSDHFDMTTWRQEGHTIFWFLEIPAGAQARAIIPIIPGTSVREGDQVIWNQGVVQDLSPGLLSIEALTDNRLQIVLGSGKFTFQFSPS